MRLSSNNMAIPQDRILVDSEYLLEKFSGKGGWTYAAIPEIVQDKSNPFGWVIVSGQIDSYELDHYKLMPMGNGRLFLPVKREIRKSIGKKAGDHVHILLYRDEGEFTIPEELIACFENETPQVFETFQSFSSSEQKSYIDWISQARTGTTKVKRIAKMMSRLEKGWKFHDSGH